MLRKINSVVIEAKPFYRFKRTGNKNNRPWKKGMFPLTIEESQSNHKRKVCYINAKKLVLIIKKLEIIVIIMENTEELLIMPGKLTVKDQNKFM